MGNFIELRGTVSFTGVNFITYFAEISVVYITG
jgi:hypothetical protein